MATAKWTAAIDRGNVLSTELNSLANGNRTAAGTEVDNSVNLDEYGWLEMNVTFGSAPNVGGYVAIYAVTAPDGTNYEDGSASVDPGAHTWVCNIPVKALTSAQRLRSPLLQLMPFKTKFILENKTGVAFPASGSTVKLYTSYETIS